MTYSHRGLYASLALRGRDFVSRSLRTIFEVDGCVIHNCPIHCGFSTPQNENSKNRDARRLEYITEGAKLGWRFVILWEHELKDRPLAVLVRIQRALKS